MAARGQLCEVYGVDNACGSGYLVAGRAVLTSGHVVGPAGSAVTVRCGLTSPPLAGSVVWRRHDTDLDAALVAITDDRWTPSADATPVRWGRLVGTVPVPGAAVGFPEFQQERNASGQVELRDVEQAVGAIAPLTGAKQGLLTLDVTSSTPDAATVEYWRGQSGAPLFSGTLLVGLVRQVPLDFHGRRLEAVQVAECLRDAEFQRALTELCGQVPQLEPVELDALAHTTPPPRSPAALLRADVRAVDFEGRADLLTELEQWCRAAGGYSVRALTGPGGQGKTRLAQELGRRMNAAGWAVLNLAAPPPELVEDPYQCLRTLDTPLLLIVDYAEMRHEQMGLVARFLGEVAVPARVLLVARALGDLRQRYARTSRGLDVLATGQFIEIPVPALAATPPERAESFRRALDALAPRLAALPGYQHIDWAAARTETPTPDLSRAATVLAVHMAALAALLRHGLQDAESRSEMPEEVLLRHESDYWKELARDAELGELAKRPEQLARLAAVAALCPAADQPEALATLARLPATPGVAATPGLPATSGVAAAPGVAVTPGLAATPDVAATSGLAATPGLPATPDVAAAPGVAVSSGVAAGAGAIAG